MNGIDYKTITYTLGMLWGFAGGYLVADGDLTHDKLKDLREDKQHMEAYAESLAVRHQRFLEQLPHYSADGMSWDSGYAEWMIKDINENYWR